MGISGQRMICAYLGENLEEQLLGHLAVQVTDIQRRIRSQGDRGCDSAISGRCGSRSRSWGGRHIDLREGVRRETRLGENVFCL